jgi:hypothetical protein
MEVCIARQVSLGADVLDGQVSAQGSDLLALPALGLELDVFRLTLALCLQHICGGDPTQRVAMPRLPLLAIEIDIPAPLPRSPYWKT